MQVGPEHLKIDKHDLDEEVIHQPELFYHASVQFALAKKRVAAFKNKTEVELSLFLQNRRKSLMLEKGKVVEAQIKSESAKDKGLRQIGKEYREAMLDMDKAEALVEAFRQRGYALKELAQLHAANYFSSEETVYGSSRRAERNEAERNKRDLAADRKKREDRE